MSSISLDCIREAATIMLDFHYVYTLESLGEPEHFYVGLTDDLATRLAKHNAGGVPHTAKHRP